jgi:hypothetical protein
MVTSLALVTVFRGHCAAPRNGEGHKSNLAANISACCSYVHLMVLTLFLNVGKCTRTCERTLRGWLGDSVQQTRQFVVTGNNTIVRLTLVGGNNSFFACF